MLKRALLVAAILIPQMAFAADFHAGKKHRFASRRPRPVATANHVIHCTTVGLGLFSYADCGQGFDPLGVAGN